MIKTARLFSVVLAVSWLAASPALSANVTAPLFNLGAEEGLEVSQFSLSWSFGRYKK